MIFFFFNDTATTEIYTLSLHDALPILHPGAHVGGSGDRVEKPRSAPLRSEEHTSELQSHSDLVCRLLLEKKKESLRSRSPRLDGGSCHTAGYARLAYAALFSKPHHARH